MTVRTRAIDEAHMRRALELARSGPVADPNPRVGCVLAIGDHVVGQGFHRGAGTPHAEVVALRDAGGAAQTATAYVTLEPCAHQGRTGPCTQALIDAGVTRVVLAQSDPNPRAQGGTAQLRAHGIEVEEGLFAQQAEALNDAWSFAMRTGRPKVTWKVAGTLDGCSAARDRSSRWITGPAARADVHRIRAQVGAVLIGTGTLLADDPSLTVRGVDHIGPQPLRVVMGERDIPAGAQVRDGAAEHLSIRDHDPHHALKTLWERQIRHVLLEGGPTLAAAFLRAGLVDELVAYIAPKLLGGGLPIVTSLGIESIAQAMTFELREVAQVGGDVRLRMTPSTGRSM